MKNTNGSTLSAQDYLYNRGIAKNALGHTNEAKTDFQSALDLAENAKDDRLKTRIMKQLTQVPEQ